MHTLKTPSPVKILERSLHSTRWVFMENSFRNKLLTGLEMAVLQEWFDYLTSDKGTHVDLFVYLRAPPTVCYERLRMRNRKEETGVPLAFIQELHNLHEEWLMEKKFPVPAPVLVLDATQDLPKMQQQYEEFKAEILCGCT